jgi:polyhydroxyalkanoate synthesis regulator phasin
MAGVDFESLKIFSSQPFIPMAGLGDFVQKAFYLGVGIAASAGEKIGDVREQAQKLADEMVARGEITTEEARKMVDGMLKSAQQAQVPGQKTQTPDRSAEPRRIEIEEEPAPNKSIEMRRQVEELQAELERLKKQ